MALELTTASVAWLAGIIEGEGCLSIKGPHVGVRGCKTIHIHLGMTDKDVVDKAAAIMGVKALGPYPPSSKRKDGCERKDQWRAVATGSLAASWMMTLYRYFGSRRQEKARECLAYWRGLTLTGRHEMPYRISHPLHRTKYTLPYMN